MRGYLDGDGSFYYDKFRNRVCLELRGTKEFLFKYKTIIEANITKKCNVVVTTPDSTSKLKYSGKKYMPEIMDFLYKDATLYMSRKHNIAYNSVK